MQKSIILTRATDIVENAKDFHLDLDAAGGVANVVRMLHTHLQAIHGAI